jgi:hypothetical protein
MAERTSAAVAAGYDVLAKWESPSFDATTRAVLARRLDAPPARRFFTAEQFAVLEAACARLLATPPGEPPIASAIDADLFEGRREGFRRPDMPPADAAWRIALDGIDAEAQRRHANGFAALDGASQDALLRAWQQGALGAESFPGVPAQRFFGDVLLKTVAAQFYSRPDAWSEIGFGGPASPRGYVRIGLDRRDPWEAPAGAPRRTRGWP